MAQVVDGGGGLAFVTSSFTKPSATDFLQEILLETGGSTNSFTPQMTYDSDCLPGITTATAQPKEH